MPGGLNTEQLTILDHILPNDLNVSDFARSICVYYCGACYEILLISKYKTPIERVNQLGGKHCPRCNSPLADVLQVRSNELQCDVDYWCHQEIEFRSHAPSPIIYREKRFRKAISLLGLTAHVKFVDRLIGGLQPGWFTIFYGSKFCHTLAERLCVKSQLSEDFGGWQSPAVFIDGGNSFDPYLFTDIAREYHLPLREALDKIIISRSFTVYQLAHSIRYDLPQALDRYGANFAVISNIFDMFVDDVKDDEAKRITGDIARSVKKICRDKKVSILVTCRHKREDLESIIFPQSDVLVGFEEKDYLIEASLLKHPTREQATTSQNLSENTYNQMLLTPLEVTIRG